METTYSFGTWIQQRRKQLHLTQELLALRVNCSPAMIRKIEGDERRPSHTIAELLAAALEVPSDKQTTFVQVARGERAADWLSTVRLVTQSLPQATPTLLPQRALPVPATPLVGRPTELNELSHLLSLPECRLLTLVGVGGVGKTRLALAAAITQKDNFAQGLYFVPLAMMRSPDAVAAAVANAIGLTFHGTEAPIEQIVNLLHNQQMLILLDNLEHLLDGVAWLGTLVQHAPGVKILATSRQRLALKDEWVVEVQGLPYPAAIAPQGVVWPEQATEQTTEQIEQIARNSAIGLFLQSARRASKDFTLTPSNLSPVIRICQLVQGLPLGIELAAAWTPVLACHEIAVEIERNLNFLEVATRDVLPRHRSLTAVMDQSWQLLTREEQSCLGRLSVLRGTFTRHAAEAIAGATLTMLAALVTKSLIRRQPDGRFEMHEILHQYVGAKLAINPADEQPTHQRHAEYFLSYLLEHAALLQSQEQPSALVELSSESSNLLLAWEFAIAQKQYDWVRKSATALWYFYDVRSHFHEGESVFSHALALARNNWQLAKNPVENLAEKLLIASTLADLTARSAWFRFRVGYSEPAHIDLQTAIQQLYALPDQPALADALMGIGLFHLFQGRATEAIPPLTESFQLHTSQQRLWFAAMSGGALAYCHHEQAEYASARSHFAAAVATGRATGDPRLTANLLSFYGRTLYALGEYTEAQQMLTESLALATHIGDRYTIGTAQEFMGMVMQALGNLSEAHELLEASSSHFAEIRDSWSLTRTLNRLGEVHLALGELAEAEKCFVRMLSIARTNKILGYLHEAMLGLATVWLACHNNAQAAATLTDLLKEEQLAPILRQRGQQLLEQSIETPTI